MTDSSRYQITQLLSVGLKKRKMLMSVLVFVIYLAIIIYKDMDPFFTYCIKV